MSRASAILSVLLFFTVHASANAAPVTFNYTSTSSNPSGFSASGFFVIDSAVFDGAANQVVSHSTISSLSITAETPFAGTLIFGTADIDTTDSTEFDSTSGTPIVTNSFGFLANIGSIVLYLFSTDGLGVTDLGAGGDVEFSGTYDVTVAAPPTTDVAEPASLAVLAFGLAGLGFVRRRRAS